MEKIDVAKSTVELCGFLCKDIDEIWENHTSEDIKAQYSLEEIKKVIEEEGL